MQIVASDMTEALQKKFRDFFPFLCFHPFCSRKRFMCRKPVAR